MASGESAGNPQAANGEAEAKMETEEQKGPVLCLDLTSYQLQDMNEVEIPTTLEEVNLTANRLTSVDPRIGRLAGLHKISFRQTLLDDDDVTPLSSWDTIVGLQLWVSPVSRAADEKNYFDGHLAPFCRIEQLVLATSASSGSAAPSIVNDNNMKLLFQIQKKVASGCEKGLALHISNI